jgi:hypothetical protein
MTQAEERMDRAIRRIVKGAAVLCLAAIAALILSWNATQTTNDVVDQMGKNNRDACIRQEETIKQLIETKQRNEFTSATLSDLVRNAVETRSNTVDPDKREEFIRVYTESADKLDAQVVEFKKGEALLRKGLKKLDCDRIDMKSLVIY